VCCCIWYSEERPGRAVAPSSAVLAVPNIGLTNAPYIIAHATTHQRPVYQLHVIQCFKILIVTRCLHASWLYQTWATAGCCPNSGRSRSLYSTYLAYSDTKTTNNRVCHPIRRDSVHQSNMCLEFRRIRLAWQTGELAFTLFKLYNIGTVLLFGNCSTNYRCFLSASLYVSKRGAYWYRLCRDVVDRWLVGWSLVVTRVHCGQPVHPRLIDTMEY